MLKPKMMTVASAIPRSLAIGESCAADIKPPAATRKNIRYMIQNSGERTACCGGTSTALCRVLIFSSGGIVLLARRLEQEGHQDDDDAVDDGEDQEGVLIA